MNWRQRALTDSRRFKRSSMHEPRMSEQRIQERIQLQILEAIDNATTRFLLLLHVMSEGGMDALLNMQNPEFEQLFGFIEGMFRIGPVETIDGKRNDNGIGLAVMPAKKVLGKEYPVPAILIPLQVHERGREDVFMLAISRMGNRFELEVTVAWRDNLERDEWPEDVELLKLLRDKVYEVVRIVCNLDPSSAIRAA